DLAELRAVAAGGNHARTESVRDVERFSTRFESKLFANAEPARQGHVQPVITRARDVGATQIAERAIGRLGERRWLYPAHTGRGVAVGRFGIIQERIWQNLIRTLDSCAGQREIDARRCSLVGSGENAIAGGESPARGDGAEHLSLKSWRLEYRAKVEVVAAVEGLRSVERSGLAVSAVEAAVVTIAVSAARAPDQR